jgi:hypothetical protein
MSIVCTALGIPDCVTCTVVVPGGIVNGTGALICVGDTKNNGAGMALKVTLVCPGIAGSGTALSNGGR